ncbi:hypothetical protein P280DRAFT_507397 [Massarina eburnea CBS 473.64]|uniref:Zn(2)-C6 fungal-type domain-containing protein n=1 Tax=Massarina eburnea CBS 473.64 TaxID=1395130 RepID=A0A6A6RZ22_9PLEO|nr:hypothetical protein P280DRAFT_507397 [Massarina eburnea CBS 473.64]
MLSSSRLAKSDGCWTCRLRRKKCDKQHPTCKTCNTLEITCSYGPKPAWMDGGHQQRQKTEWLKNEIKRKATYRREKANANIKTGDLRKATHDVTDTRKFDVVFDMVMEGNLAPIETMDDVMGMTGGRTGTPTAGSGETAFTPFSLLPSRNHQWSENDCTCCIKQSPDIETDFITKYFDFVFPALFPFYRPALFETGRSWLLALLGKSKVAYHSTVGLSCYFFTMALTGADVEGEHDNCKELRWEEVEQQTNKCFESIRTDMLTLNLKSRDTEATNLERVHMMESVVQVLIFEIALGNSAPWNSHLPPAFALLDEIMTISDPSALSQAQSQSYLTTTLLSIGSPLWTRPGYGTYVWSPDQTGFRFCAGFLLFIDVIASTALRQSPKLLKYHADILTEMDDGIFAISDAEVRLSSIVGCRNWVVRSIARVAALEAWKLEQINEKRLSVVEMVGRAEGIAAELRTGILGIQNGAMESGLGMMEHRAPFDMRPNPHDSARSTIIWAHAAQLYLAVVVSGWQMSNTEVRANVTRIIELLTTVPAYQLRAFAWPLCVAGCLALGEEESFFTALVSNQGKVYTAGALDDVRQIMRRVWQRRTTLDVHTWTLASCFNVMGSPVLLA